MPTAFPTLLSSVRPVPGCRAQARLTRKPLPIADSPSAAVPVVRLQPRRHHRFKAGHPWVYSNEIEMTPEVKALPGGSVVNLVNAGGEPLGAAMFNAHSLVAARTIAPAADTPLDRGLIEPRLAAARNLRDRLIGEIGRAHV